MDFKIDTPVGSFQPSPDLIMKVNEKVSSNLGAGIPQVSPRLLKSFGAAVLAGGLTWYLTKA